MIRVFKRHGRVVRVKTVRDGPVIRNAAVRSARQHYLNVDDALSTFIDSLNDSISAADGCDQSIGSYRGNSRVAGVIKRAAGRGGYIMCASVGISRSHRKLGCDADLTQHRQ